MSMQLDLGAVSAYAVAVANGYVGTEAQWETEIANASANAQAARTARVGAEDAQQAAETAQGEAEDARDDAEKYALGTVGGAAVPVSDSAYHNNAKYYAEQAGASNTGAGSAKTDAETAAGNAEAYSVGTRDGVAVESTDPAYHNNAKYYSDQAADANTNAGLARTGAETASRNAEAYAVGTRGGDAVDSEDAAYHNNARYYSEQAASENTDAAASALKAEGYAVGKQDGVAVTSGSEYYKNNAKYYAEEAASVAAQAAFEVLDTVDNHALLPYPTKTIENQSIVSFDDGIDGIPLKELEFKIEPVQDLHGYDNPWPAGGGKNLLPPPSNSTYISVDSDGTITVNGTVSETSTANINVNLPSGTPYTLSVNNPVANSHVRLRYLNADGSYDRNVYASTVNAGGTFTPEQDITRFWITLEPDTYNNFKMKLQIEAGSSATSFAPYSNICPISGHTECEVVRAGKNLCDITKFIDQSAWNTIEYHVKPNTNYTASSDISESSILLIYLNNTGGNGGTSTTQIYAGHPATLTSTADGKIWISQRINGSGESFVGKQVQLEEGSIATDYEPFRGNTYDIDFPSEAGTVYGGTLTVNQDGTGTLVVDKGGIILDNVNHSFTNQSGYWHITPYDYGAVDASSGGNLPDNTISSFYNGRVIWGAASNGTVIFTRASNWTGVFEDVAAINNFIEDTPQQLVYDLATPVTYTLTAEQIETILGRNNIWVDTGDITKCTYRTALATGQELDVVNAMIAGVEASMTASQNYAIGDLVVANHVLYKITAAVASGETLNPDVSGNCEVTTLAAELAALKSEVDTLDAGDIGYSESDTYAAGSVGAKVSNLKSALQSTEDYALAAYPQETLENQSIASFSDGADDIPIKELTAYIEPVQDLHGYDNPWPAGGGKNIFGGVYGTKWLFPTPIVVHEGDVWAVSSSSLSSGNPRINLYDKEDAGNRFYNAGMNDTIGGRRVKTFTFASDRTVTGALFDSAECTDLQIEIASSASSYSPYSNICPISGHTECKVVRTGKNLLDVSNAFKTDRNFIVGDPVNSGIPDGSIFLPAGDYALQTSENVTGLYVVTKDGTIKTVYDNTIATFTNPKAQAFRLIIYKSGVTIDYWDTINVWLSKGSTATAYEPFGTTYDIDFPSEAGTVYGGTLTVHQDGSGTLVVDRETYTGTIANATLLDVYNGYRNYQFYPTITHTPTTASSTAKKISNIATYRYETSYNDTHWYNNQYGTVTLIAPDGLPTATPVQFTMPLASKISFILSAEQVGVITTLLGTNNIWHSCNGNLDITYRADLAKYITKDSIQNYIKFSGMIAGVETGLTASKAYNSGDYFIIGQKLYKAIASIANGAAFTVGTNCTETTVGAELVTLNS